MRRRVNPPLACAAMAAMSVAGCSSPKAAGAVAADAPAVAVARVVRGDVAQRLTIAAEFRPFQEIDVHAKVAGYVKAINVDVGDRVKAGQLLAVLEIPELQDELQQAAAAVGRAQEEVARAQADLQRARSAHDLAHLTATRLANVLRARPNLVAQQDIDDATGRDKVAEAQVATAQAAVAADQQQLEVARAAESKTKTLYGYSQITAPFDGVVTHRYADLGAMIQAGTSSETQAMPLVKLSENRVLRLTIPVPESAVPLVRIGQPVDVTVPSLGKTFPGTVSRFADKLDPSTRTMHTEVDVKNPDLVMVPGMYASVVLTLAGRTGVLTVPVESVDRNGDQASVVVVDGNRTIATRTVTLGIETPTSVEVVSGLNEGDLVVLGNRAQLKAGTLVSPKLQGPNPQE